MKINCIVIIIALTLMSPMAPLAQVGHSNCEADIEVEFSNYGKVVSVVSSKDISHIVVEYCYDTFYKYDNLTGKVKNLNEGVCIVSVKVKSGCTYDLFCNPTDCCKSPPTPTPVPPTPTPVPPTPTPVPPTPTPVPPTPTPVPPTPTPTPPVECPIVEVGIDKRSWVRGFFNLRGRTVPYYNRAASCNSLFRRSARAGVVRTRSIVAEVRQVLNSIPEEVETCDCIKLYIGEQLNKLNILSRRLYRETRRAQGMARQACRNTDRGIPASLRVFRNIRKSINNCGREVEICP